LSNFLLQDCDAASTVESAPSVNNTRCGTESWFTQRTVDPTFTLILEGSNAKFLIRIVLSDTEEVVRGTGIVVTVSCTVVGKGVIAVAGGWAGGTVWVHPQTHTRRMVMVRRTKPFFID
jgi:hypothetical protein